MRVRFFIMAFIMLVGFLISVFATDRLTRFCLYTPLKVLLISLGIAAILWGVSDWFFEGVGLKGYFEVKGKDLFFYPFFVCFSCALSSYTIFLCKVRRVRDNNFSIFCCFFVLPVLLALTIIATQSDSGLQAVTFYYMVAFLIPQSYFFLDFLRKNRNGEWDEGAKP